MLSIDLTKKLITDLRKKYLGAVMNIRQLEVFSKVAETESITLAAKQLFMSQPAVSKTIRELESDLGI